MKRSVANLVAVGQAKGVQKRVYMVGFAGVKKLRGGGEFHDFAALHYQHPATNPPDHAKIIFDKGQRQAKVFGKRFQQVKDLCLRRGIQPEHNFIGPNKGRF